MARRKPQSAKQHRAQLQYKRAVKRGDVVAEPTTDHRLKRGPSTRLPAAAANTTAVTSARRLQSTFVKLSPALLEQSKILADRIPLIRPIPPESAIWPPESDSGRIDPPERERQMREEMRCMRRPKWRYDMSKKEVEKNEEGLFAKWLGRMDGVVDDWVRISEEEIARRNKKEGDEEGLMQEEDSSMPPSPTFFERNLEVWRQLWRVTELSQILLILLDSRCPMLHFPPSLRNYLSSPHSKLILVLTKIDISGPERAEAWAKSLRSQYPDVRVVMVESYMERTAIDPDSVQGKKRRYEPRIPQTFKQRLVTALKEAHEEMLEPPDRVKQDAEKLKSWKPRVKREIDWDALLTTQPIATAGTKSQLDRDGSEPVSAEGEDHEGPSESDREPEFLTIGLIGQPNVGKSSLLNALFGTTKVRASKTPGKASRFLIAARVWEMTMNVVPDKAFPNTLLDVRRASRRLPRPRHARLGPDGDAGKPSSPFRLSRAVLHRAFALQVLSGILPIARMPALPLCVSYASQRLPLERIFNLPHPSLSSPPVEDKRTWRDGTRRSGIGKEGEKVWTAMDVMSAYAEKKGWVTAKAGRLDVNRAGNAILRALAEGKVKWAFWPPDTQVSTIQREVEGKGIWIPDVMDEEEDETEYESEEDEERGEDDQVGSGSDAVSEESETEIHPRILKSGGMFAALRLSDGDDESEDDDTPN